MRILSVGAGLGRGGTERAMATFSLEYRRIGHEVAVLAWQEGGHRREALERAGIQVFLGGRDLRKAIAAADAFAPDLIHIHRVGVERTVEATILKRLRTADRRVIETNVFGRVDRSPCREHIDVHMHLSDWCLWRWRRWLGDGCDNSVGAVVPNPVDCEAFHPLSAGERQAYRARLGIPSAAFVCGRIGQPSENKWHRSTFTAFAALASVDPGAYLLLRGLPPGMRPHVRALPPGIQRRVIELPLVDTDRELVETYSAMDVFLHASRIGESFGYVLTEAMLCGCPVVTASTPHVDNSQVEVVGHMAGGVVAASLDGLPDALLWLHANRPATDALRPGLRDHVTCRYSAAEVSRLALRVGELALATGVRAQLQRQLDEIDRVPRPHSAGIEWLMRNTIGAPARRDLMYMRVRHHPRVQRVFDAHLSRRLRRSIRNDIDDAAAVDATAAESDAASPPTTVPLSPSAGCRVPSRVALLVNFIPPYRISLFRELRSRVSALQIFVSTPVEPNRQWPVQWDGLEVARQRSITLNKRWKRPEGFDDQMVVHLPYDTYTQLRRFRPEIVISGELGLRTCLAAAYCQLHPRTRLVIWATLSERTERGRGAVRNLIRPLLLRQADAVFVNGASGARYVRSHQVPPGRIWEIPYTIDVGAFARESVTPAADGAAVSLLCVGLLIPRKGLRGLMTALTRWARAHPARRIQLSLVGEGPEREAIGRFATPPNLTVHLLGNVAYDALPELYRSATMLVMPTLEDEWGVVVNEAMAAGLPVLGSRYSQAVEELVTDGETGWTFTPDDPRSIDAALDLALTATPDDIRRMGLAARERAMHLTPSAIAERIAQAIDTVRQGPNMTTGTFGAATQQW